MSEAKDILKQIISDELTWIASLSHSSDKESVKDAAVKWITFSFTKKQIAVKYSGGTHSEVILAEVKKTNLYKFASVVDVAETEQEFIRLIKEEWKDDGPFKSILLTKTWDKIRHMFTIDWKLRFTISKERMETYVARTRFMNTKKRLAEEAAKALIPPPLSPVPERPWIENIPQDYRHIVQMLSEQGASTFQRQLIKTILLNKFDEEFISTFAIRLQNAKSMWYEIRITQVAGKYN